MKLAYPLKGTIKINQGFGSNPDYYSRFGTKGHMGIDFFAPHGTPVYAAIDGIAHYEKDSHGGEGIVIFTALQDDGKQYQIINWHLCGDTDPAFPSPFPLDGKPYPVKQGDLIGHADNTGAPFESTGDHLHFGVKPYDANGAVLYPDNGFGGCIDPAPFLPALPKYQFTKDFGFLSRGEDVRQLQARLGVLQTGFFWTATRAAVKGFQAAHNIQQTGYVGPLTRAALNS